MNGFEKQIKELLRHHGWTFFRSGKGSHEVWKGPNGDLVTVNHVCKSRFTANGILKAAGIDHRF